MSYQSIDRKASIPNTKTSTSKIQRGKERGSKKNSSAKLHHRQMSGVEITSVRETERNRNDTKKLKLRKEEKKHRMKKN